MGNSESSSCEEETAEEEEDMDQETIDMFVSGIGRLTGKRGCKMLKFCKATKLNICKRSISVGSD